MRPVYAALAMCMLSGCGNEDGEAGGDARRAFQVTGFDRVALTGPDDVKVATGPAFRVEAQADRVVLDRIEVGVRDGELRVGRTGEETGWRAWLRDRRRGLVLVTMPMVRGVTVSGAGDATVAAGRVPVFVGAVEGAGGLSLAGLDARNAAFSLSGAGNLDLAGQVGDLTLQLAGAGNIAATELRARDIDIIVSGVGNVEAAATGHAKVQMTGVGRVDVKGTEDCEVSTNGAGNVSCAR